MTVVKQSNQIHCVFQLNGRGGSKFLLHVALNQPWKTNFPCKMMIHENGKKCIVCQFDIFNTTVFKKIGGGEWNSTGKMDENGLFN